MTVHLDGLYDGLVAGGTSPAVVYEQHGRALAGRLRADCDIDAALTAAAQQVRRAGWAVLSTDLRGPSPAAELAVTAIGCWFGTPTRTAPSSPAVAWPITPDHRTTRVTFSQTSSEAALHTDTQYFPVPEQLFLLACMHADRPGRGTNQLVDGRRALRTLHAQNPDAAAALKQPFPFRVPTIFTCDQLDTTVEVTWAPIDGDPVFRYRHDTITDALGLPGVHVSGPQMHALHALQQQLAGEPATEQHLADGDVLLVDNHRMLHARTAFTDPDRFLYRVRMRTT
jgi:alpha-ketoglutarate-dependent taurine dioxygenase